MASVYDEINAINADQIRNGLSPLVNAGANKIQIAALQLQRQRELQDQAQKNLFAQQLLDRQQRGQSAIEQQRSKSQIEYLREQSKFIAERQAADDERAYRKQIEAEAFRYGVDTKGKSPEQITKEVDAKIASNVKDDIKRREGIANQIINLTQQSSLAAKKRVTQMALSNPSLLTAMDPKTVELLRNGSVTIDQVINKLGSNWKWFGALRNHPAARDATAAYNAYAQALKTATEQDKELNPDFPLAVRLSNLNNDLQILDKNISDQFGRIRNADLAKGIFESQQIPKEQQQSQSTANPMGAIAPIPGGFPIVTPTNPLGLALPPTRPLPVSQPTQPVASRVGAVIPAVQGGPYGSVADEYGP